MDSKKNKNESHIGSEPLFGDRELTSDQKVTAAEAAMAAARAEAAEGGRIAGEARTAGDERRRMAEIASGNLEERELTPNEDVGYLRELRPGTLVDIEDAKRAQADAAEAARGALERLKRDERIRAQEAINEGVSGPIKDALRKKHPTSGEGIIADSKEHIADEEKWKRIIADKGDEPTT